MGPSNPPGLVSLTLGFQEHVATPAFLFFNTYAGHQTQVLMITLQVLCLWIDSWHLSPCNSIKPAPHCLKPTKIHSFLTAPAASQGGSPAGFDSAREHISLCLLAGQLEQKVQDGLFCELGGKCLAVAGNRGPPHSLFCPFHVALVHRGLRNLAQTVKMRKP